MAQPEEYQDHLFNSTVPEVFNAFREYVARHPIPPSFLEHSEEIRFPFYWQNMVPAGSDDGIGPSFQPPPIPSDAGSRNLPEQGRGRSPGLGGRENIRRRDGGRSGSPGRGRIHDHERPRSPRDRRNNREREHDRRSSPPHRRRTSREREHGRTRGRSREHGRSRSREHGRSRSPLHGRGRSREHNRSRSREHGRSRSPLHGRGRSREHDRTRNRAERKRARSRSPGGGRSRSQDPRRNRHRWRSHTRSPRSREGERDHDSRTSPPGAGNDRRRGRSPAERDREGRTSLPAGNDRRRERSPAERDHDMISSPQVEIGGIPPSGNDGEPPLRPPPKNYGEPPPRPPNHGGPPPQNHSEPPPRQPPRNDGPPEESIMSPTDVFKAILPKYDAEFNPMFNEPVQDLPPCINDILPRPNSCADYHNQVKAEREILERLRKSTEMLRVSMEELNQSAKKEQEKIEGFPSMTTANDIVAEFAQYETVLLAKSIDALNSMQNIDDPNEIRKLDTDLAKFQIDINKHREQRHKLTSQRDDLNKLRIKIAGEILENVKASKEYDDNLLRRYGEEQIKIMDELKAAQLKRQNALRDLNSGR